MQLSVKLFDEGSFVFWNELVIKRDDGKFTMDPCGIGHCKMSVRKGLQVFAPVRLWCTDPKCR